MEIKFRHCLNGLCSAELSTFIFCALIYIVKKLANALTNLTPYITERSPRNSANTSSDISKQHLKRQLRKHDLANLETSIVTANIL